MFMAPAVTAVDLSSAIFIISISYSIALLLHFIFTVC